VALVYGVIHGGVSGWMTPATLAGLAVGALGLAAFVLVEHRAAAPLLRPQLFASGGFTAAGLAAMAVLFTVVGVVFVLTLFFAHQQVSGLGIAVRLGCLFGGNAAASLTSARLQALTSPRTVLITGLLIATVPGRRRPLPLRDIRMKQGRAATGPLLRTSRASATLRALRSCSLADC